MHALFQRTLMFPSQNGVTCFTQSFMITSLNVPQETSTITLRSVKSCWSSLKRKTSKEKKLLRTKQPDDLEKFRLIRRETKKAYLQEKM